MEGRVYILKKFSVIVPIYNCADYLQECLDSIIKQYNDNFELLLINDGSTDGSLKICNEYCDKYSFVRVFSKKNEGLLLTRRFALKYAKNEWIAWVDADDYISDSYFKEVEKAISTNEKIDMVLIKSTTISNYGKFLWEDKSYYKDGRIFYGEDDFYELYLDLCRDFKINAMWKKIAKRTVFDIDTDYSLYQSVKGEDLLQSVPLFDRAKCVIYIDKSLYYYRLSKSGLGRNLKAKYVQDFQNVYGALKKYIDTKYPEDFEIHKAFSKHYVEYLAALLKALPINISKSQFKECVKIVMEDSIVKSRNSGIYKRNLSLAMKLLIYFELLFPDYFYNVAVVIKKIILFIKRLSKTSD